jgi:hypothetical protein
MGCHTDGLWWSGSKHNPSLRVRCVVDRLYFSKLVEAFIHPVSIEATGRNTYLKGGPHLMIRLSPVQSSVKSSVSLDIFIPIIYIFYIYNETPSQF